MQGRCMTGEFTSEDTVAKTFTVSINLIQTSMPERELKMVFMAFNTIILKH